MLRITSLAVAGIASANSGCFVAVAEGDASFNPDATMEVDAGPVVDAGIAICSADTNCSGCPDQMSCKACFAAANPSGAALFNTLESCIVCVGCYEAWNSLPSCKPPANISTCDGSSIGQCFECATAMSGPCHIQYEACFSSSNCMTYGDDISRYCSG